MSSEQKRRIRHQSLCSLTEEPAQKHRIMKCQGKDCGRALTPDDKFCPDCGKENKQKDSVTCSSCGKTVEATAKFCGHCGAKATLKQPENQPKICTGTNEDGSPCQFNLEGFSGRFCLNCGTKVDQEVSKTVPRSSADGGVVHKEKVPELNKAVISAGHQDVPAKQDQDSRPQSSHQGSSPTSDDKKRASAEDRDAASAEEVSSQAQVEGCNEEAAARGEHHLLGCGVAKDSEKSPQGKSEHPQRHQGPAPVPCSDDVTQAEVTSGRGASSGQSSVDSCSEDGEGRKADSGPPGSVLGVHDRNGAETSSGTVTGSQKTYFAEYADEPFIKKETISNTKQKPSNRHDAQSSNMDDETKRKQTAVDPVSQANVSSSQNRPDWISKHKRQRKECEHTTASAADEETEGGEKTLEELAKGDKRRAIEGTNPGQTSSEHHHAEKKKLDRASGGGGKRGDREGTEAGDENKSAPKDTEKVGKDKKNTSSKEKDSGAQRDSGGKDGKPMTSSGQPGPGSGHQTAGSRQEVSQMSYAGAITRGMTAQNSAAKNTLSSNSDKMTVVFHVIVSDMWEEMDPQKYNIFIRCQPSNLGGWNPHEDKNKMAYIKKTVIGYLYEGKIVMERHLRNSGFYYKYIARKTSKGESKLLWELVQRRDMGTDPARVNRYFSIPEKSRKQTGDWHRYDGASYFPGAFSKSVWEHVTRFFSFKSFGERIHQDAFSSADVFLPSVEEIMESSCTPARNVQTIMEGHLEKVIQVMSSLKFQMRDTSQTCVDEDLVNQVIMEVRAIPLVKHLAETGTVTLGVFVLLLVEQFSLPVDFQFIQIMCRSMLISPAMNNTSCADLDSLESHFPTTMANKSDFAKKIIRLINQSDLNGWWQYQSDTSWLYCVPLLHFLQGRCKPFQDLEPSTDFRKPEWWGLTDLDRRKRSFMQSTTTLRLPQPLLELLTPSFQVDPLFLRTLVASLELEPLLPILTTTGLVPLDVMAATLTHHIQYKGSLNEDHKMKVEVCLGKMVSMVKEKAQKEAGHSDLKQLKCSAKIVHELHQQLMKNRSLLTKDTLLQGTCLVLLTLDHVTLGEERVCQENDGEQTQSWREEVRTAVDATCNWLSSGFSYSSRRQWALPMWDKLTAKVEEDVAHGDLKSTVKKVLAEGFEKKMELLSAEQKLEIYLEQYKMAPAFADIHSRLAFESLDAAFKMEYQESGLLSTFIERKWEEQVKDEDQVLHFVITWNPMVNYFLRFGKHFTHFCFQEVHEGSRKRL